MKHLTLGYRRIGSGKNPRENDIFCFRSDSVGDAREQLKMKVESKDIKYVAEEWKLEFCIDNEKIRKVRCEL